MTIEAWSRVSSSQKRTFLEAIDLTISSLLGEGVKESLYEHLEKTSSLKRDDIPDRLGDFIVALQETTGRASKVIERAIAKNFYSKLGLDFEARPDSDLSDYLEVAMVKLGKESVVGA